MDIDLLSKMVKELILDNDKVVLPGLGCFVAEIVPSTFSDKGYTINPPYRRLSFRPTPDEGDMLVQFYATSNGVSNEVAGRIVIDFIKELKQVLHSRKMVVFPGLGRMRATKENNIFFVADENLDIYPSGFGLQPISMKTHNETVEELSAAVGGLASLLTETSGQNTEPEPDKHSESIDTQEDSSVAEENLTLEPAEETAVVTEAAVEEIPVAEKEEANQPQEDNSCPSEVLSVKTGGRKWRKPLLIAAAIALALAVMLLIFVIVGHLAPDFIDKILYTTDELEILHYNLTDKS